MLALACAQYLALERVDVTVIALELGVGRATIYRWFGSREGLLGEVLAHELETLVADVRRHVRRRGVIGLLQMFDRINRALAESRALRRLVETEREGALRVLTSSSGIVQPRAVALVTSLIQSEHAGGRYEPPADAETLAYAIVRLAEAFLYNDAAVGVRGDAERLWAVEAALLGAPGARRPRDPRRRGGRSNAGR